MGNNDGEAVKPKTPNPVDVEVGAKIRARRGVVGMSQAKLGEAFGRDVPAGSEIRERLQSCRREPSI